MIITKNLTWFLKKMIDYDLTLETLNDLEFS